MTARRLLPLFSAALAISTLGETTQVTEVTWQNRAAYRLTDGKTEAIVVPELSARVMSFRRTGATSIEWLWQAPAEVTSNPGYKNWGGDKTFIAPQHDWRLFGKGDWPPLPGWDGGAHEASVTAEGRLRTRGPAWTGFEIRVEREFWFEGGEFVVQQTFEKTGGEPRFQSIWNVTQMATPEMVYMPLNPESAYRPGYHAWGKLPENAQVKLLPNNLLAVTPLPGRAYKIGADAPAVALVAQRGRELFRMRAKLEKSAQYPEGAPGAGLTVEYYNHGEPGARHYVELELLSPLHRYESGTRRTHTIRWSLQELPPEGSVAEKARELIDAK